MRWPLFIADTPFPPIATVRLYEDTWKRHILLSHPEVAPEIGAIERAVQDPHIVCAASSVGGYTFVSGTRLDEDGRPLIVVVTPKDSSGFPVVATSYFGSQYYLDPEQTKHTVYWVKK
jgi:hypothetical protein